MSDGTERNDTVTKIPLPSVGDSLFAKSLCRMTDVFLCNSLDNIYIYIYIMLFGIF